MLNVLTLRWTMARLRPGAPRRAVAWILGGALLRWSLAVGLLVAALQRGIVLGLMAFAGLWLARWGMVCWIGFGRASPEVPPAPPA